MTRAWDEFAAAVFDVVPGPVLLLLMLLVAGAAGALWFWYPVWLPGPRTAGVKGSEQEPLITAAEPEGDARDDRPEDEVPATPADRLAAEGRFAEAIRQRLREMVRDLVVAGVLAPQPGWTVTELAALAAAQRPGVAGPFGAATELFSQIWYAGTAATREHDNRMRALAGEVTAALAPAAR